MKITQITNEITMKFILSKVGINATEENGYIFNGTVVIGIATYRNDRSKFIGNIYIFIWSSNPKFQTQITYNIVTNEWKIIVNGDLSHHQYQSNKLDIINKCMQEN